MRKHQTAILRFCLLLALILGLGACGGGGGGGSLKIELSPNPLEVSVFQGQVPAQVSVFAQASGSTSASTIYVIVTDSGTTFPPGPVPLLPAQGTLRYEVQLTTSADLSIGTHTGTLQAKVCSDPNCQSILTQASLPYSITVKAPRLLRYEPSSIRATVVQGGRTSVQVVVEGVPYGNTIYAVPQGSNPDFDLPASIPLVMQAGFFYNLNLPLSTDIPDEHRTGRLNLRFCSDPLCSVNYGADELYYDFQVLSVLAGLPGQTGLVDGQGGSARFNAPYDLSLDGLGNLYVLDGLNYRIRKIDPDAVVSTLPSRQRQPLGVAADAAGNLYFCEYFNEGYLIQKRSPAGAVMQLAAMTLQEGYNIYNKSFMAVDSKGNVYMPAIGDGYIYDDRGSIFRFGADGSHTQLAYGQFRGPYDLTFDADDNLYVGEGTAIKKLAPDGSITSLQTTGIINFGSLSYTPSGAIYAIDLTARAVFKVLPSGFGTAVIPGGGLLPNGQPLFMRTAVVSPTGRLYTADENNHVILSTQLPP